MRQHPPILEIIQEISSMDIYAVKALVEKYSNYSTPWLNISIKTKPILNFNNDIDDDFFNHEPIPGPDHDEATIELIREKVTKSWKNADERRKDLIYKNKTTHKKLMVERWKNPTDAMKNRVCYGRPKGAKDLKTRKQRTEKKVYIKGQIYYNAKEAADVYGIHVVNVRRRCRLDCYEDWKYID